MPWNTQNNMNQRSKFVLEAQKPGANISELCREFGISRKTAYKWLSRYEEGGVAGMADQSRRPKSPSSELPEEVVCRIVQLRRAHETWGARKLVALYERAYGPAPSESSVKRILAKTGMAEKQRPRRPAPSAANLLRDGRKAAACNDIWTVDFKGWWYDAEGKSMPLTVRDEHSRYVLELRHLEDGKGGSVKAVFERLFTIHGLPKAIRSDNGSPFACASAVLGLTKLSAWWLALGIELERSRPGCPQDNGAHERMHADVAREIQALAKRRLAGVGANPLRQAQFDAWREEFNSVRPHEALEMRRPADVYTPSERKYEPGEFNLSYEGMEERRVQVTGQATYERVVFRLPTALAGWTVGLKREGDWKTMGVYFAGLRLGHLDLEVEKFQPVAPPQKAAPKRRNKTA